MKGNQCIIMHWFDLNNIIDINKNIIITSDLMRQTLHCLLPDNDTLSKQGPFAYIYF